MIKNKERKSLIFIPLASKKLKINFIHFIKIHFTSKINKSVFNFF